MKAQLVLLSFLLTMFVACVKEDERVPDLARGPHRIARINIINSHGEITKQYRYTYQGENLIKESCYSKYDGEMVEMYRTEFSYAANEITGLLSRADDFQKPDTKYVYRFENVTHTEYSRYTLTSEGVFDERERIIYRYLDDKIVSSTGYLKRDGNTLQEVSRRDLKYDNGYVIESKVELNTFNVWQDKSKYCFYYRDNKLEKRILSFYNNDSWNEATTISYSYDGDNLTRAILKHKDIPNDSLIYKYDHDYLVKVKFKSGMTVYEYEPGQGNYSFIFDKPGEFLIDYQGVK